MTTTQILGSVIGVAFVVITSGGIIGWLVWMFKHAPEWDRPHCFGELPYTPEERAARSCYDCPYWGDCAIARNRGK